MLVYRLTVLSAAVLWSAAALAQTAASPNDNGKPSRPFTSNGMPVPVQSDRPVSSSRTSGMNPEQKRQDKPARRRNSSAPRR